MMSLSDGRFELGLGVGWMRADFEKAGIPFGSFHDRIANLEATVAAIRSDDGAPRIIIGGGPKMLAAAARLADVVTFNIPLGRPGAIGEIGIAQAVTSEFEQRVETVRESANAAGRTVEHHIYVHAVHLGPGWRDDAERAAGDIGLDVDDYLDSPHVLAGDAERIADTMRARHAAYGIGYVSVPGQHVDSFAPVLAVLAG